MSALHLEADVTGSFPLTNGLPTTEKQSTNQRYQDCHKPLISLVGKLPRFFTKITKMGKMVGW
jgi:hypothetical protein